MAGPGKTGPKKTYLYGNKAAQLGEALEKGLNLRVGVQFNPDECRVLRDYMDLNDVAEPTHAIRLAIQQGVAIGSQIGVAQRLKTRIVTNEIRGWVLRRMNESFREIIAELGLLSSDADSELMRLNAEYTDLNEDEASTTEG
jgi:hypothetical protein